MFPKITEKLHQDHRLSKGATLILSATFLYVLQDTLVKMLPPHIPFIEIIFFRSVFALIPTFYLAYKEGMGKPFQNSLFKSDYMAGHLIRSGAMVLSLGFYIIACRALPLTEVYALSYTSPLFITLLSGLILKEAVTPRAILAVCIGFLGVILIIKPGSGMFNWMSLAPLMSGLFTALAVLWGRQLTLKDSTTLISLTYILCTLVPSAIALPFNWAPPQDDHWYLFIGIGILGGLAQWLFIEAFRQAPANRLAPLDYIGIVWATLIGVFYFKDQVTPTLIWGAMAIIGAGIYNLITQQGPEKISKQKLQGFH